MELFDAHHRTGSKLFVTSRTCFVVDDYDDMRSCVRFSLVIIQTIMLSNAGQNVSKPSQKPICVRLKFNLHQHRCELITFSLHFGDISSMIMTGETRLFDTHNTNIFIQLKNDVYITEA